MESPNIRVPFVYTKYNLSKILSILSMISFVWLIRVITFLTPWTENGGVLREIHLRAVAGRRARVTENT